jgi:hypothetical protein
VSRWYIVGLDEYERVMKRRVKRREIEDVVRWVWEDEGEMEREEWEVVLCEGEEGEEGSIGCVFDEVGVGDRGLVVMNVVEYEGKEVVVEYWVERWINGDEQGKEGKDEDG